MALFDTIFPLYHTYAKKSSMLMFEVTKTPALDKRVFLRGKLLVFADRVAVVELLAKLLKLVRNLECFRLFN